MQCIKLVILILSTTVCAFSFMFLRKFLPWYTQNKVVPFSTMATGNGDWKSATSIYDFTAKDIDGNEISLDKYRGHVSIIVNVASK